MISRGSLYFVICVISFMFAGAQAADDGAIDWDKAKQLFQKSQRGETLSAEDQAYLDRAKQERQKNQGGRNSQAPNAGPAPTPKPSTGLIPLNELGTGTYKNEDGGLYGGGKNEPPETHLAAAKTELSKIVPLDADGKPAVDGKIAFISISMSNATMEFSAFKRAADSDAQKASLLTIVDCAQGGKAMAQWVDPNAPPWAEADKRLAAANISKQQVQIAWVKLANMGPRGELADHGRKLEKDTIALLNNAKARFPNLRIVYLGSRIYGGYATTNLNPEPYAYEGAFAVRWLIQDQIKGQADLNYDPAKGAVKSPLLLWGPYFWADGTTARKSDGLIWEQKDFGGDGTHPSESGKQKVVDMLLKFCKTDPLAQSWFLKK